MDFEKKVLGFLKCIAVFANLWLPGIGFLLIGKYKIGAIIITIFILTFFVVGSICTSYFGHGIIYIVSILYLLYVIGSTVALITTEF